MGDEVLTDFQPPQDVWEAEDEYELDDVSSDEDGDDELGLTVDEAQEQWEESVDQLKKLFSFIILPLAGKFFGRRFAYYAWGKYVAFQNSS